MDRPCDEADDTQLLARAVDGDETAFAVLFHRYHPMIYAFAYRLCLDATDAQEIAQETFVKAARSLDLMRGGAGSLKGWLYRIARNTATDLQRAGIRRERLAHAVRLSEEHHVGERPADFSQVTKALAALPLAMREAVVLVYFDELSHAEAARVLGCAEVTVSWRVFKAKRKLKLLLSRRDVP